MGNIYILWTDFPRRKLNTRRHLSEFWMIEPELAFAVLSDEPNSGDYLSNLCRQC
jgi:asparaginyl-tRNA synthetase